VKEKKGRNCQTRSGKKKKREKKYKPGERRHPMQKTGQAIFIKKKEEKRKKAD